MNCIPGGFRGLCDFDFIAALPVVFWSMVAFVIVAYGWDYLKKHKKH